MLSQAPTITSLAHAMDGAGVRAMVLRNGVGSTPQAPGYRPMQLLVPSAQRDQAVSIVEALSWRYAWVRRGLLRLVPGLTYAWDGGRVLELYWSLPAAPAPAWLLRSLTAELWRSAGQTSDELIRPHDSAFLVHLAVQSSRSGRGHDTEWEDFVTRCRSQDDQAHSLAIARRAGVLPALRVALHAAQRGDNRPSRGPTYQGPHDVLQRLASGLQRSVRRRRLGRLLAGAPIYGDAAIRCRIAGVEVVAGPGVFVPAPAAELFAEAAIDRMKGLQSPCIVEVGTGCGAIALAIARSRQDAEVHATELSGAAVRWARRNARNLELERVQVHGGSLLDRLPPSLGKRVDLMIANLPYIPPREHFTIGSLSSSTISGGGEDGLALHRRLARAALQFLRPGGYLQLQMLRWQWDVLSPELESLGFHPDPPRAIEAFAICSAQLEAA